MTESQSPVSASTRRIYVIIALFLFVVLNVCIWRFIPAHHPPANPPDIEQGTEFATPAPVAELVGPFWAETFVPIVLSIATLLGIAASIVWQNADAASKILTFRNLAPLVVSPIVLLFTYTVAKDQPSGMVATLMAFQNGFFWQEIIGKQRTKRKQQMRL